MRGGEAERFGHPAECGNAGAASIVLEDGGRAVRVTVCRACGKVIVARVVLAGRPYMAGAIEASAMWAGQLLGADVGDLVVKDTGERGQPRRAPRGAWAA